MDGRGTHCRLEKFPEEYFNQPGEQTQHPPMDWSQHYRCEQTSTGILQNVYGLYFLFRHGYPTSVLSGAQNPCVVYYLVNGKQIRNGQLRIIMYK